MSNIFVLSEPTAFPEFNKKQGHDAEFTVTELTLKPLKYKHFREAIKYPEEDQMHRLMLAMTGLSDNDVGELTPSDAAEISKLIFNAMKKHFELGKSIINEMEKK